MAVAGAGGGILAGTEGSGSSSSRSSPRSHPLMARKSLDMAALGEAHLLVRERGSGSRTTVERLFREAGLQLRIGSEMSSNESLKQMCAAGFGPAYLSMHTCVLEMKAGLLQLLPLPNNPLEREWFVVRIASKAVPQVAHAFEHFLRAFGQQAIDSLVKLEGRLPRKTGVVKAERSTRGATAERETAPRPVTARRGTRT